MYIGAPTKELKFKYERTVKVWIGTKKKWSDTRKKVERHKKVMQGHFNHGGRHEWHFVSFGTP